MSWESWRENTEGDYHPNFKWRGPLCLKRSKGFCEFCHIQNGIKRKNGSVVMLSACHLDHNPLHPRARLAALCQSCHNKWDGNERQMNAKISNGQKTANEMQTLTNLKVKGDQDKLRRKNRRIKRELFVDTDWRVRNLARKSEGPIEPSQTADQLNMFAEDKEGSELLPCIHVGFSIAPFMETVSLKNDDLSTC